MDPRTLTAGDKVDRFTVVRLLGIGGIANVYHVRHDPLGTDLALKVLQITGPSLEERLSQEGWVQSRVRHPNVVAVSDAISVHGMPALVMELVPGPDLSRWLGEHQPDLELAERLFRGIVAGVRAAHQAGVIHRDLKPANVLLDLRDPSHPVPKVADFGLVKIIDRDAARGGRLTHTGIPMGTPNYMAPEQIDDPASVDQRADIHSLGCILFRLVAHRQAFPGDDPVPVFMRVATGRHAPLPPDLPLRIAYTIERCLAVSPADRPADCDAILALLDGRGLPAPRRAPSAGRRALAAVGRMAIATAMLASFGGGTALALATTAGLIGMVQRTGPPACPAATGAAGAGTIGHVPVPWVFDKALGDRWTLLEDTTVRELPGKDSALRCVLERGAQVTVLAEPAPGQDGGSWLAVDGAGVTHGQPVPAFERQAGVVGERCAGPYAAGWVRVSDGPLGKRPRAGSTWTLDGAAYVVSEPDVAAPTVCALRRGATVNLYEPPIEADGGGWWIPVVGDGVLE